ncbi:acrosin-like [Ambystoma mexicanum]|uniref:acrosin-like n=1 Tax=Ambystoma mexicanum TaxID=8296 RepID=UPI0037E7AD3C
MLMGPAIGLLTILASLLRIPDEAAGAYCGNRPLMMGKSATHPDGGSEAAPGAWPWIVSIQSPLLDDYYHVCAGTVLNNLWVLTAATCFKDEENTMYLWRFVIGTNQLSHLDQNVQVREPLTVVIHEGYNKMNGTDDIALVKLNQAVVYSRFVQPACLPITSANIYALVNCQVCGWSVLINNVFTVADELLEANISFVGLERCNSITWHDGALFPYNLCAGYGEDEIDNCPGDFGGPLMCQDRKTRTFYVVGVTSWGRGCLDKRNPAVFTSTHSFLKWIQDSMSREDHPNFKSMKYNTAKSGDIQRTYSHDAPNKASLRLRRTARSKT